MLSGSQSYDYGFWWLEYWVNDTYALNEWKTWNVFGEHSMLSALSVNATVILGIYKL